MVYGGYMKVYKSNGPTFAIRNFSKQLISNKDL